MLSFLVLLSTARCDATKRHSPRARAAGTASACPACTAHTHALLGSEAHLAPDHGPPCPCLSCGRLGGSDDYYIDGFESLSVPAPNNHPLREMDDQGPPQGVYGDPASHPVNATAPPLPLNPTTLRFASTSPRRQLTVAPHAVQSFIDGPLGDAWEPHARYDRHTSTQSAFGPLLQLSATPVGLSSHHRAQRPRAVCDVDGALHPSTTPSSRSFFAGSASPTVGCGPSSTLYSQLSPNAPLSDAYPVETGGISGLHDLSQRSPMAAGVSSCAAHARYDRHAPTCELADWELADFDMDGAISEARGTSLGSGMGGGSDGGSRGGHGHNEGRDAYPVSAVGAVGAPHTPSLALPERTEGSMFDGGVGTYGRGGIGGFGCGGMHTRAPFYARAHEPSLAAHEPSPAAPTPAHAALSLRRALSGSLLACAPARQLATQ